MSGCERTAPALLRGASIGHRVCNCNITLNVDELGALSCRAVSVPRLHGRVVQVLLIEPET